MTPWGVNQGRSIDPFSNSYLDQEIKFANYGVNSSVVLFNGNNITTTLSAIITITKQLKWITSKARILFTLNVILAYLQVLSNKDQLQQNINQAGLSRKQVERLEVLDKDGAISPSQLYDLKGPAGQ
jgi:outer membrane protein